MKLLNGMDVPSTNGVINKLAMTAEGKTLGGTVNVADPPEKTPDTVRPSPLESCRDLTVLDPEGPFSAVSEQFRLIRARLLTLRPSPDVVLVSSPMLGDGKTFTSVNLAASLAMPNADGVLLIDADMRRPMVANRLNLRQSPGLSEVLAGWVTPEEAIVRSPALGDLAVLPAGGIVEDPARLLSTAAWKQLVANLRTRYRRIIIDSPPTQGVGDFPLLAQVADGVILVCRLDKTKRPALDAALRAAKGKLLGVILNGMPEGILTKTPTSRYYRDRYRPEQKT